MGRYKAVLGGFGTSLIIGFLCSIIIGILVFLMLVSVGTDMVNIRNSNHTSLTWGLAFLIPITSLISFLAIPYLSHTVSYLHGYKECVEKEVVKE